MFKRSTLKNGLRLLLLPMAGTRALTVLFLARTGSKYETKKLNGISHLLEHLVFRGTRNWPEPAAIARELDSVGGLYNAFTDKEMLGIWAKVESKDLSLALKIIADMVSRPLFLPEEIRKEKKVIVEEINMREDNPSLAVLELWEELLYGSQPAGWPVIGSKESVNGISKKDLFEHRKKSFVGRGSLVVVAGRLTGSGVQEEIARTFGELSDKPVLKKEGVTEKQKQPAGLRRFKKTDQTHLCLGVRTFGARSPQKHILSVLVALLGGMMSSRLFEEVREKRGLAYYLSTLSEHYTDTGYLLTRAGIANEKVSSAIEVICREYRRLKKEKVGLKELEKAKENLRGRLSLGLETSDEIASYFGLQEVLNEKIQTPEQEFAEIAKVGQDDILRVAREIFRPEKINLALVGPQKDGRKFLKALRV
ncbi:MAG: insulinase family protein [Candidatus Nealsonbacteria bacterium]|nr:insulinase family protein [Candidatus Nealsonbacteria bacterium]